MKLYGVAEVAREIGKKPQLVAQWLRRGTNDLPEPNARLAMGPVWYGKKIEQFIATQREGKK